VAVSGCCAAIRASTALRQKPSRWPMTLKTPTAPRSSIFGTHRDTRRSRALVPADEVRVSPYGGYAEGEAVPQLGIALPQRSRDTYALTPAPRGDRSTAAGAGGRCRVQAPLRLHRPRLHDRARRALDQGRGPAFPLLEVRHTLGLDDLENVNYLQAIKRVIGMAPLRTPYQGPVRVLTGRAQCWLLEFASSRALWCYPPVESLNN
jgi:hypothetical protein